MLEAYQHSENAFVTLTYSDEYIRRVKGVGLPTLLPEDTQLWLKRLRKLIAPQRVRFFLVGEYGDETERPHYHAALFNFASCRQATSQYRNGLLRCCDRCELVRDTWGKGNVYLGTLEAHSAQYVCGYVTKKMTAPDDARLQGRHPEFARMSRRPGIGQSAMDEVASELMRFNLDGSQADVPSALRHGKRELPLGRYLQRRLRKLVGKDEKTPDVVVEKIQAEVQPVRQAAFDASRSFADTLKEENAQKALNLKTRMKLRQRRKVL